MTSPIKPPGGGPPGPVGGPTGPGGPEGPDAKSGASEAFQEALEAAQGADEANQAREGAALDEVGPASLSERLRAGELDAAGVVDALVERALARPEAAALDEVGRAQLEAHLRRSLAEDPNLSAMVEDLERGR